MAVIGIDGIDEGRYSTPTLTTIEPDKGAIARTALQLLFDRITDDSREPRQIVTPHTLRIRRSA